MAWRPGCTEFTVTPSPATSVASVFKNAVALQQVASLDTVVLDKTGTLTKGEPQVVAVVTADGIEILPVQTFLASLWDGKYR